MPKIHRQPLFLMTLIVFYVEAYQRFVEMPVGPNNTTIVDLHAAPNFNLLNKIQALGDTNEYVLYTRQNTNSPQYLSIDDDASLLSSNFDARVPTAILINGWQSSLLYGLCPLVKKALLDSQNVNVILVDWRRISKLDYATAATAVPRVGRNVGAFLEYLHVKTGAPYSSMHLIGHSLGAHISGNAGRRLNGKVARITGLDPAGPGWYLNPNSLGLTDAVYVEAIHTNALGLGIQSRVGDVDFYANGGAWQPGCINPVCHHGRSYELFAASIAYPNHLIGKKCKDLAQMEINLCRGSEFPMGDNDLKKSGSGIYRLNTGRVHPF